MLSRTRSRLSAAGRWLAPSVVAAAAGALGAGALEGVGLGDVLGAAATAGFLALFAIPALIAGSVAVRAIVALWRPREVMAGLAEDGAGGGVPRLAGTVAFLWVGALALAWAMFQGTWQLHTWTKFKPDEVSFGEPLLAIAAVGALIVLSRPGIRMFSAFARRVDARWRRRGHRTLLTPVWIFGSALVSGLAVTYVLWRFVVTPRLGPIDTSLATAPLVGIAVTVLAHALWHRVPSARRPAGLAVIAMALTTLAIAVASVYVRPSTTLEIWGDRPLAGLAIERLFDIDAIRTHISLAEFRPTDRPGSAHPDIILVTIDTVRADHTPPYGGKALMPVLQELAVRGAVFDYAYAPSNVTRRSIPSMVIGLAPNRVKGRVVGWALRVDPRHVLLAERLQAAGYETAGFMCCHGFWAPEVRTGLQRGLEHLEIETDGRKLAAQAHAWLLDRDKRGDHRPLFLWMHILEPHNWTFGIGEPKTLAEKTRYYDASLAKADGALGELMLGFTDRPPERAPIVIVTADHGEALGDHGQPYHSTDLYNAQLRVPLVVTGPGIKPQRVDETVSLTDLVPTLVDLAGFTPPSGAAIDGHSIADLITGRRAANPDAGTAFAAMIKDRSNPGGITAVVRGRWKLIENGSTYELYDTRADPEERSNVSSTRTDIAAGMRRLLDEKEAAGDVSPF